MDMSAELLEKIVSAQNEKFERLVDEIKECDDDKVRQVLLEHLYDLHSSILIGVSSREVLKRNDMRKGMEDSLAERDAVWTKALAQELSRLSAQMNPPPQNPPSTGKIASFRPKYLIDPHRGPGDLRADMEHWEKELENIRKLQADAEKH